jgi:hypothetical protein
MGPGKMASLGIVEARNAYNWSKGEEEEKHGRRGECGVLFFGGGTWGESG